MRIFCSTVAALKCCKSFSILGSIIHVLESHPVLAANLLRFCCWQQLKWTNVFNILSMLYTLRPICKPVGYFDVFGIVNSVKLPVSADIAVVLNEKIDDVELNCIVFLQ